MFFVVASALLRSTIAVHDALLLDGCSEVSGDRNGSVDGLQGAGARGLLAPVPPECSIELQRLALVVLYNDTSGPQWANNTGWPSIPGLQSLSMTEIMQHMATVPLQSDACSATSSGNITIALPDHCCWYGVSCCRPDTCGNNPSCSCIPGVVTGLHLGNNRVGALGLPCMPISFFIRSSFAQPAFLG